MSSEWGSEREKEAAAEQELGEEEVQKVNLWEKVENNMSEIINTFNNKQRLN